VFPEELECEFDDSSARRVVSKMEPPVPAPLHSLRSFARYGMDEIVLQTMKKVPELASSIRLVRTNRAA